MQVVTGASLTLSVAQELKWQARFYKTSTGKITSELTLRPVGGTLTVVLPDFEGSIAVKLSVADGN